MTLVKFGDVVRDVKVNVDRINNPYDYYVAGDHMNSEDLTLRRRGKFSTDDVGPAFIRIFKPGQILYGSRRTYLKKVAVADYEGITANTTFVLETKDEKCLSQRLLPFLMLTDGFTNWSIKKSKGSTNPYVLFSDLADYELDLPPIEEQGRLAELLWAAYDLKESYKKLIAATDEMVKSQFIEMFGNPMLTEQKWTLKPLGQCCEINPKRSKLNVSDSTIVSFIPMQAVSENGYIIEQELKEYREVKKGFTYFQDNDVLFAKITPCMENGKGAIAYNLSNGVGMGSTEFHVLRPIDSVSNSTWLLYLTKLPLFRKDAERHMIGTAGQRRVPANYLSDFLVGLPPIEVQNEFKQIIHQADKSKAELQKSIEGIDKVMKSLLP